MLLENEIVTVDIDLAQISSGHMLAKSEMIALLWRAFVATIKSRMLSR